MSSSLGSLKSTAVGPGYIKLEGDHEMVQYIDNSKYQICLFEACLKTAHILNLFPKIVISGRMPIFPQHATDQHENGRILFHTKQICKLVTHQVPQAILGPYRSVNAAPPIAPQQQQMTANAKLSEQTTKPFISGINVHHQSGPIPWHWQLQL